MRAAPCQIVPFLSAPKGGDRNEIVFDGAGVASSLAAVGGHWARRLCNPAYWIP